jgi:hypothetical protein
LGRQQGQLLAFELDQWLGSKIHSSPFIHKIQKGEHHGAKSYREQQMDSAHLPLDTVEELHQYIALWKEIRNVPRDKNLEDEIKW